MVSAAMDVDVPFAISVFGGATDDFVKEAPDSGVKSGDWVIEGIAATSDLDGHGHIITPDAIRGAVKGLSERRTVLFNHNMDRPIGRLAQMKATDLGLWIKMILSKAEAEIWQKVQEGVISRFSVRIHVPDGAAKEESRRGKAVLVLSQIDIREISLVSVPANTRAKTLQWYVAKALQERQDGGENNMGDVKKMTVQQLQEFEANVDKALGHEGLDEGVKAGLQSLKSWINDVRSNPDKHPDVFGETQKQVDLKEALEGTIGEVGVGLGKTLGEIKTDFTKDMVEVKGLISKVEGVDQKLSAVTTSLDALKTLVEKVIPQRRGAGVAPVKSEETGGEKGDSDVAISRIEKSDEYSKLPSGMKMKAAFTLSLLANNDEWLKMDAEKQLEAFKRGLAV